jgi:hypothetical protein
MRDVEITIPRVAVFRAGAAMRLDSSRNPSAPDGLSCTETENEERLMKRRLIGAAALLAGLALPLSAQAQGVTGGIEKGAHEGGHAAGAVGAVVGGAVGGVVGGVAGVLGVDQRPRFRTYVVERHVPSYTYRETVRVGTVLPAEGITYYEVPAEYGLSEYRYTVINEHPVLVEPRTRRVVEIIE